MKNNKEFAPFLQIDMLALSLCKLPIPMMTITEKIDSYMQYTEELRIFSKSPRNIRKRIHDLISSIIELVKSN